MGLGPMGAQTLPFRLTVRPVFRPVEPAPGVAARRARDRRLPGSWAASPRSQAIDTTARGRARTIPASPADLRGTFVSRSCGAPRDHRTTLARSLHDRRNRVGIPWSEPGALFSLGFLSA